MTINLWTKDRVGILNNLWKEGHSARDIAQQIGSGISRNAVIGKAYRLGLSQKQTHPIKRPIARSNWQQYNRCQWPIGHPNENDFHFCGDIPITGKPYCDKHCAIAYTNHTEAKTNNKLENAA